MNFHYAPKVLKVPINMVTRKITCEKTLEISDKKQQMARVRLIFSMTFIYSLRLAGDINTIIKSPWMKNRDFYFSQDHRPFQINNHRPTSSNQRSPTSSTYPHWQDFNETSHTNSPLLSSSIYKE